MSLALARKYRPATFSDLIGQEAVSQTLSLALTKDRLSHAYLFSGLRGSGKTSTARIFAKALLCEEGPTATPCGVCAHCNMASSNSHMDIIEMDAASNRGIEDIKELIEHTKYQPSAARFKIFIIDEVHMLTNQAFNALLKTLEEPPDFVKFILATTDPLKLPATILSRTQHFRFKKIPEPLIKAHLEHILNLEEVGFEDEALQMLARTGAGSLRDSLTLLDQAIVYSKNHVDITTVTNMLGIIEPSLLENLVDNILQKDSSAILEFVRLASDYEAEMVLDELTLYLKSLLLNKSSKVTPTIIERFFRVIAESKQLLLGGSDGEFVLTLSLFKMMESLEIREIDTLIKTLEKRLSSVDTSVNTTIPEPVATPNTTPPNISNDTTTKVEPKPKQETPPQEVQEVVQTPPQSKEPEPTKVAPEPQEDTRLEEIKGSQGFEQLKTKVYDRDYDLGTMFEANITFVSFDDSELKWESSAEGDDKSLLIKNWALIRTFVQDIFGVEVKIVNLPKKKVNAQSTLAQEPPTPQESTLESEAAVAKQELQMKSSCIAPEAGNTEAAKEKEPNNILEEPMVKEILEMFEPKKVRVKRKS